MDPGRCSRNGERAKALLPVWKPAPEHPDQMLLVGAGTPACGAEQRFRCFALSRSRRCHSGDGDRPEGPEIELISERDMGRTFESLSSEVLGAAVEVHRTLGPGFLETTCGRAMRIALERKGIPSHAERESSLAVRGAHIGVYRVDLVVDDRIIVELKAVRRFEDLHFAQLRA